ncbi:low molecular weight protein-tyrosine-phosphatase wzb [bacterium BMS3Abin05]|nr:low molecular weight protein-tyrosine-phosphatase wzb [bacterium BMS3Abin05]
MKDTFTVLFVCTGNSCRSPMAEGIFRRGIPVERWDKIRVLSAGTGSFDGSPPTRWAIEVSAENGIDISEHRSRALRKHHLAQSDIVFVMEKEHLKFIHELFPNYQENVYLLKAFDRQKKDHKNLEIPDPIGKNKKFYRKVFRELEKEIHRINPRILQLAQAKFQRNLKDLDF